MSRSPAGPAVPDTLADALPCPAGDGVLRRLAAADLGAFQAYRHDPELGRYQGWSAQSDAEALAFLVEMGAAALLCPGAWSQIGIADAATGTLVGDIGLMLSSDTRQLEIGFTLAAPWQGRGVAARAVRAAIDLVFEHSGVERVVAVTDARNRSSVRLLERVGLRRTGTGAAVFRGENCIELFYGVDRPRTAAPALPRGGPIQMS